MGDPTNVLRETDRPVITYTSDGDPVVRVVAIDAGPVMVTAPGMTVGEPIVAPDATPIIFA